MEHAVQSLRHVIDPTALVLLQLADIKDRYEQLHVSRTDVQNLSATFNQLRNDLLGIQRSDLHRFSARAQDHINSVIPRIRENMKNATEKLEAVQKNVAWTIMGVLCAPKNTTTLRRVDDDAKHCALLVAILSSQLATIEGQDAPRYVAPVHRSPGTTVGEEYCSSFPLETNMRSNYLTLDFETKNEDHEFVTCEGRLKSLVLGGSRIVGAVDNRAGDVDTAVALGGGGVGKTCALIAIAKQEDVRARFPDGIFFSSLGADACVKNFVDVLAGFVAASGGTSHADEIRQANVDTAVVSAARWFSGKTCLFIFDDVWNSRKIPGELLHKLTVLVESGSSTGATSRLVFSTRDGRIAETLSAAMVKFEHRTVLTSQEMLLKAAESERDEVSTDPAKRHFDSIVLLCGGLPFSLNIAGRLVVQMKEGWENDPKEAWHECDRYLGSGNILDNGVGENCNLYISLDASVKFLDRTRGVTGECTFTEAVASLSVFNRQDWVPLSVCEHLWGVQNSNARQNMRQKLSDLSIVTPENRRVDGNPVLGFQFHDHVHAYAKKVSAENFNVDWIARLVSSYEKNLQSDDQLHCWPALLQDDGYIAQNICRFLLKCGRRQTVARTLYSGRWVAKMMASGQVLQYDQDINAYMKDLGAKLDHNHPLRMLSKVVRLSQPDCVGHIHAAWFQLYARLQTAQPPQDMINRFFRAALGFLARQFTPEGALSPLDWITDILMEAEQCAARPFLRPSAPCLKYPSAALLEVYTLGVDVEHVQCLPGGDTIACGYACRGEHISIAIMIARASSSLETKFLQTAHLHGSDDRIEALCISENGHQLASAHRDKKLRLWSVQSIQQICEFEMNHADEVCTLRFNQDGTRIASGSFDRTVRVWDVATGEQVGAAHDGHTDKVKSVCFSTDGGRIVSGSHDGTVRVWNAVTGEPVGTAFEGHTRVVSTVCFSSNGNLVVSGSHDRTVRVWNATTAEQVGRTLYGHTGWVSCVSISADGKRIVAGLRDSTVRVWDRATGEQVGAPFDGHTDRVTSLCFSADGTHIVSGSRDSTVRMWDIATSEQVVMEFEGHTSSVSCICFSANGKRVVSGSHDTTVRVWDTETGNQACKSLDNGHTGWVSRVAISADGSRVVSRSDGPLCDNSVRFWNAESAGCVKVLFLSETAPGIEREAERFLSDEGRDTTRPSRVFLIDGNAVLLESEDARTKRVATFDDSIRCYCVSSDGVSVGVGLSNGTVAIMQVVVANNISYDQGSA